MGQMYGRYAIELKYFPTDIEVYDHVNKFGPFISTP